MLVITNACRMAPVEFRDAYLPTYPNILQPSSYPAVQPLYWNHQLNQSSRAHAADMASTPCFQHDSCDGTAWFTRIRSYYTKNVALAENIASGFPDAMAVIRALIADGGAADNSSGDGHRRNIMNGNLREMGNGYAVVGSRYYVQDFGGGAPEFVSPVAVGSHMFLGDGQITFWAGFHDVTGMSPQGAVLIIDGRGFDLSLVLGQTSSGTYEIKLPLGSACRNYFFQFVDGAGVVWRYPESGLLVTTEESGCSEEFVAQAVAVDDLPGADFSLGQNTPNPFSVSTSIRFTLVSGAHVEASIYNVAGRLVRVLADREYPSGTHALVWDGRSRDGSLVQSGFYYLKVQTGGEKTIRRMLMLR